MDRVLMIEDEANLRLLYRLELELEGYEIVAVGSGHFSRKSVTLSAKGATALNAAQYDEIVKRLEKAGAGAPKGRLYHVCYGTGNQLRVTEVWDPPKLSSNSVRHQSSRSVSQEKRVPAHYVLGRLRWHVCGGWENAVIVFLSDRHEFGRSRKANHREQEVAWIIVKSTPRSRRH
jgi:CheY-like chemotaxis protein